MPRRRHCEDHWYSIKLDVRESITLILDRTSIALLRDRASRETTALR